MPGWFDGGCKNVTVFLLSGQHNGRGKIMGNYIYREDSGYDEQFEAPAEEAAEAHALELLRSGDYGLIEKTLRVSASVARVGDDGEPEDWRTVTADLEPAEPACEDDREHDWQEGQSFSSGGGVTWTDTCARCGLRRTTDTWDHDHATGTVMKTVAYERAA